MSDEQIVEAENAINDLFGLKWMGKSSSREFLTTFKKWDKEGRGKTASVAKNIYNLFDLSDQYEDLHKLTSDYKDVTGVIPDADIKKHFRDAVPQHTPNDGFQAEFGRDAMMFFDKLESEDRLSYGVREGKLVFKLKSFDDFQNVLLEMIQSPHDELRIPAQKMSRMYHNKELIVEDF